MDDEEKKASESFINQGKEKLQSAGEKAEKAKRAFKIFMKLPTPVKIAIIAVPLGITVLLLFLTGAEYIINAKGWEDTASAKSNLFGGGIVASAEDGTTAGGTAGESGDTAQNGTGYSYSEKAVKLNEDERKWEFKLDVEDTSEGSYRDQLLKSGFTDNEIDDMSQSEIMAYLLLLNGADQDTYTKNELKVLPYLIKAELATQQVDLREADDMYKSNGEYNAPETKGLEETDEIQGTIHFKRVNSKDVNDQTVLSYINYETFKGYGESSDIDNGKKYFSFNNDGDLVIYTWSHAIYTYDYIDGKGTVPDSKKQEGSDEYTLQETVIDYKPLVSQYTLPFEVLAALLITTEDCTFTKQVADLAFTSNIEISLIEEYTEDTTVNTTQYYDTVRKYQYLSGSITVNEQTSAEYDLTLINNHTDNTDASIDCKHTSPIHGKDYTTQEEKFDNSTPTYTINETIYTETNNYKFGVTKADIWFAKIEKELLQSDKETTQNSSIRT